MLNKIQSATLKLKLQTVLDTKPHNLNLIYCSVCFPPIVLKDDIEGGSRRLSSSAVSTPAPAQPTTVAPTKAPSAALTPG